MSECFTLPLGRSAPAELLLLALGPSGTREDTLSALCMDDVLRKAGVGVSGGQVAAY